MESRSQEQQLVDALREYPPDIIKAGMLLNQGADINAASSEDPDRNLLSQIYCNYSDFCGGSIPEWSSGFVQCGSKQENCDGRYLPMITKFFLDNGFCVEKGNGQYGAVALNDLQFAPTDAYALDCCRLLLSAGADPSAFPYEHSDENALENIESEASFCYCEGMPYADNLYTTMCTMMRAKLTGGEFRSIETPESCIGRKISNVFLCSESIDLRGIFSDRSFLPKHKNCYADTIVLDCDGKMLTLSPYTDIMVDPNVVNAAKARIDISAHFKEAIYRRIRAVTFDSKATRRNGIGYHEPVIHIYLEGGKELRFSISINDREDHIAWFEVI